MSAFWQLPVVDDSCCRGCPRMGCPASRVVQSFMYLVAITSVTVWLSTAQLIFVSCADCYVGTVVFVTC